MNSLTLNQVLVATIATSIVIFSTRAFPFVLFSKKDPPRAIRFVEKLIPPMIMAILVVYCLRDLQFTTAPYSIPSIIALAVTVVLHLWRHNPLISIFGGTILYMVLSRIM